MKVYIIKEYSQSEDDDSRYTDRVFPEFYELDKALEYSEANGIYGIIEEYDKIERDRYYEQDDFYGEIPEILNIFDIF